MTRLYLKAEFKVAADLNQPLQHNLAGLFLVIEVRLLVQH